MRKYCPIEQMPVTRGVVLATLLVAGLAGGCAPKVQVAAPEEPITINLNVKIDHEVRIKVEKELEQVLSEDSGLF